MSELKFIPLTDITMLSNYRDVEPVNEKDKDIIELSESIAKHGVMQAILVRPNKKPGHYELIFGHRRLVASKLAKLETIPANVKAVSDDEILEYQVTENLQRKDVHPMDEAKAFAAYMKQKGCDTKELAAKFAKPERYIVHRLGLNNLLPEIQKDFIHNKLTIAQAEIFGKLNEKYQKELKEAAKGWYGDAKYSKTPEQLRKHIEVNFLLRLDKAPWKKDDAGLVPEAGSCKDCQKRTACHALLFEDIAKDDRCMDGKCFFSKMKAFIYQKAMDSMVNSPEIIFVFERNGSGEPDKKIIEEAKKLGVPVVDSNNYSDSKGYNSTIKKKALHLNGSNAGKITDVFVKGVEKGTGAKSTGDNSNLQMTIDGITQRRKRSEELDYEKIMVKIRKQMEELMPGDKPVNQKLTPEISSIAWFILYDSMGFNSDEIMTELLLDEDSHDEWDEKEGKMLSAMMKLSEKQKANILLQAFLHKYGIGSTSTPGKEAFMLRKIAAWLGVDIALIEDEQKVVADKRLANAKKKIDQLKQQQPVVKKKKTPTAKTKSPTVKKKK